MEGRIVRAYGWVGDQGKALEDVGPRTPEGEELGFQFIDRTTVGGDWEGLQTPGEDDVLRIAGKWSLNPQELDAYDSVGDGFLGEQP